MSLFEQQPSMHVQYAGVKLVNGYYMPLGTFQAPQMRPYELKIPHMDYTQLVQGLASIAVNPGQRASGVLSKTDMGLGKMASILTPSQLSQGDARISGRWSDERYMMVLMFEVLDYSGNTKRLIVSGVTDPVDFSMSDLLPADLMIWPTSLQTLVFNGMGMRLTDSRMIISDTRNEINGLTGHRYDRLSSLAQAPVSLRPYDAVVAASAQTTGSTGADDYGSPTMTLHANSVINPSGVTATIDNNRPSGWLGVLMDAWLNTDPNDDASAQLSSMSAALATQQITTTPILTRLCAEQFDNYHGSAFSWDSVLRMHPEADQVVKAVQVTGTNSLSDHRYAHDNLSDPDQTLFITAFANQLTSYMDHFGLTDVYFAVTNDTVGGLGIDQHEFNWLQDASCLNPKANLKVNSKLFMNAIKGVLHELSMEGCRPYALTVYCQRYHSARIEGNVDELAMEPMLWTLPVAAEMTWSPTVAAGTGHLTQLAESTQALFDGCNDARHSLLKNGPSSQRIITGTNSVLSRNTAERAPASDGSVNLNFNF